MRRREFITLLGGAAAAWPLAARAQQPAVPVIGLLTSGSRDANVSNVAEFRKGLHDAGYVEGQNVMMEYRWDDGQYDRMPELAAELVRRRVAVIATPGSPPAARAAKAATATIPIVFGIGEDPVKLGLVASLDRPGGNLTGINFFSGELVAKRLGLLRELLPGATRVALLVNPADSARAEYVLSEAQTAARVLGLQIEILKASTVQEINAAFATLMRDPADALFVGPDGFFNTRRVQFANLAARHRLPTTFAVRNYVEVGGLMSYGTDLGGMYREVGVYTGRILKGAKPADLPVLQSTKFELVINIQTARMLELEIPPTLLAHTDEVIE
jgi:putative tryptophan/tyrosine transport system substrate-binding protein